MGDPARSVCGVLVTYRADAATLRNVLKAVFPQVNALVLVDNGTPGLAEIVSGFAVIVLDQGANVGLAAAQNAGIAWARHNGHSHVLLLDQDSIPARDMVAALLAAEAELGSNSLVGAVGPVFTDSREQRPAPFVRMAFPRSTKIWCDPETRYVQCDFLISSGTLIRLSVLDKVSAMDEGLFIDNVDMEWSFRARSRGYALYGVCSASMQHNLGDARVPVLGGHTEIIRHRPQRLYFMMRNRLELYRRPHTPSVWIAQDVIRIPIKFLIFAVLVPPRLHNVRYMLRGLLDGIRRRSGPCPIGGH